MWKLVLDTILAASGVQYIHHMPSPFYAWDMQCGRHWVWHLEASVSICWHGRSDTEERVSVPVGGESTRELQHYWLYTMSAQRVWKKDIRRQSREINVSGLNSNLLMFSMATIWRRGELWCWEGGKNSCLFLNSVMERLTLWTVHASHA